MISLTRAGAALGFQIDGAILYFLPQNRGKSLLKL